MKLSAKPMTKWILSLVFALVVISLVLLPQVLKVESQAITADDSWYGDGSASTFTISTAEQFWSLFTTYKGNSFEGKTIKLTADIDLNPGWEMRVAISENSDSGTVTLPTYPPSGNIGRMTNFKGTLDGQGHTVSGIYAKRIVYNGSHEGGLFYEFNGTLKNLAITNSAFIGDHTTNGSATYTSGGTGSEWGGLCGRASGTFENLYIDADCFLITNYNHSYGYIAAYLSGATTVTNVTLAGRFAHCNTDLVYKVQKTDSSACGVIAGQGNSCTVSIQNFHCYCTRKTPKAGSAGTNNVNYLVHWGNGSVSFSGTNVYLAKRTSSASGWTNQMALLGTYTSCSVVPAKYVDHRGGSGSFTDYYNVSARGGNQNIARSCLNDKGATYTIGSTTEYNNWAQKMTDDSSHRGQGETFNIICDLDFGGNAAMTVTTKKWQSVTLPSGSNNIKQAYAFRGTLNGNGHALIGVLARRTAYNSYTQGGLFYSLESGAVVKNLAIVDSFIAGDHRQNDSGLTYTDGNTACSFGAIAGQAANATFENLYINAEIWMINSYAHSFGVLVGTAKGPVTASNITIGGRFAVCNAGLQVNRQASGCATGLVAAYCDSNDIVVTTTNLLFCGDRYTFVNGDGSDLGYIVHYNRNGCSVTGYTCTSTRSNDTSNNANYHLWTAKDPTADGTNYIYVPNVNHVLPAAQATLFSQTYAQQRTNGSNRDVRLVAKITKATAKGATEVGFRITYGGNTATVKVNSVYKTLKASGTTYDATTLGGVGNYIYGITVKNVPVGTTLTIEPVYVKGSNSYYGKAVTYTTN